MSTLPQYRIVYWCYILHIYIPFTLKRGLFNLCVLSFTSMVPGVCIVPYSSEHTVINSGKLLALETSRVIELGQEMLYENHTLCSGILTDFSCLGYFPENIRVIGGPTSSAHSKSCKIWHIPSRNIPLKSGSDPRLKSVCVCVVKLPDTLKRG